MRDDVNEVKEESGQFPYKSGYGSVSSWWRVKYGHRGFLRPLVLRILEEGQMNGIGIMNKIQEMSKGWWKPSPGSIYPLLEQLSAEKLIKKGKDGKYGLTALYKRQFGLSNDTEHIITTLEGNVSYLEELSQSENDTLSEYSGRLEQISKRLSGLSKRR